MGLGALILGSMRLPLRDKLSPAAAEFKFYFSLVKHTMLITASIVLSFCALEPIFHSHQGFQILLETAGIINKICSGNKNVCFSIVSYTLKYNHI